MARPNAEILIEASKKNGNLPAQAANCIDRKGKDDSHAA
jgi:hypothetical protein